MAGIAATAQDTADIAAILAHRHDQGDDLWTTPDRRLLKGAPFSALESARLLHELGVPADDPALAAVADLFLAACRPDGRVRLAPGALLPCHSAHAAALLCLLGHGADLRVCTVLDQLLDTQQDDGGWRCLKFSYGRGPETDWSNPFPSLVVLEAFRDADRGDDPRLDAVIDFLLWHWETRAPIGPCHYGIGTLFGQVEYPFRSYNLFRWVHTLSAYPRARRDPRFLAAVAALESQLVDGQIVVQRVVPKLAGLHLCTRGRPSRRATARWHEIEHHLGRA